jgi:DNA repair exonuclease SbcCD nuclease subunit
MAHPSIESRALSTLGIEHINEKWIKLQNSSCHPDMISIAMAHGMIENSTLHPDFLKANYHCIALGDDHKMHKVTDHAWYSGSTQMWSYDEFNTEKGYLMVEVDKSKAYPRITPKKIDSSRRVVCEIIDISANDIISSEITRKVKNILDSYGLNIQYEYATAARVKIILKGKKTYGASFNIGEVESFLRRVALDSSDYNIVEFILDRPDYPEHTNVGTNSYFSSDRVEFLIEDPEKEFKEYLSTMRNEDLKK